MLTVFKSFQNFIVKKHTQKHSHIYIYQNISNSVFLLIIFNLTEASPSSKMSEMSENIKVFVRVRPSSSGVALPKIVRVLSNNEIALFTSGSTETKYKFDGVFTEFIEPEDAYNVILLPIVEDFIQGYNCTLFSYGAIRIDSPPSNTSCQNQMSSTPILSVASANSKCISSIPDDAMTVQVCCSLYRLFDQLTQLELSSSIRISYLEIHDEELFDLLQPNSGAAPPLKIFENDKNQVHVNGLTKMVVHTAAEAIMIYRMAQKHIHSMKSHSIFTIYMQTKEVAKMSTEENGGLFKYRQFCLVQLGSQESQKKQIRAKSVQSITSLSRVVQALTNKQSHIPYRDSKLTRIMQESLGGNVKTSIVASIGSAGKCIEDTAQALEFLNRMKGICNHPKVNERFDDLRSLNEIATEIRKLQMDIEANRNKTGHFLTDEMYVRYQDEIQKNRNDTRRHKQELQLVNETRNDLDGAFSTVSSTLNRKNTEFEKIVSETAAKQKQLQTISSVADQRQVLIERHASTEKKVTEQATEITNTVEAVLADKEKLDDCVARYRQTDDHLVEVINRFECDMHTHLDKLRANSTKTQSLIDTNMQNANDLEKNFLRCASSITEIIKSNSVSLLDKLEADRVAQTNISIDTKHEFDDALKAQLKSIDFNATLYKAYARKFEELSSMIEAAHQNIRQLFEGHFVAVTQMIVDIQQRMKEYSADMAERVKVLRLSVDECAKIGSAIDKKIQNIYDEMAEIVADIQQNTLEIKTNVEPALDAAKQNLQQSRQMIVDALNANDMALSDQCNRFIVTKLPDNFKATNNELKTIAEQKVTLTHDTLKQMAINDTLSMEGVRRYFETHSTNILSKCEKINSNGQVQNLQSQLKEHHERLLTQNKDNIDNINQFTAKTMEMCMKNNNEIVACAQQLKYFRESDFCVYESSGETPAKREYSTDISLVETTPLNKIKQRFRDRLSQINAASPNAAEYSFLNE